MALAVLGLGALGMMLVMSLAWLVQRATRNAGWVDAFWSFGLGLLGVGWALAPLGPGWPARQIAIAALFGLWSARLGLHLALRSARGPEDARYAALRRDWGPAFERRMFGFLQIQAAAAILLALAVLVAAHDPVPGLRASDLAGLALLAVAILGEAIADRQLRRFSRSGQGRPALCDRGLWAWSRHPNYFFQWLGWLAYPLLAIAPGESYPWGWLALAGPLFMYWVLVHASGIPPLEAHLVRSRGAAYRAYQRRTSAFFPLPPRRSVPEEP